MLKVEEFYFGWFVFRVVFEVKRRRKCWGFWGLVFVVVGRERNCWVEVGRWGICWRYGF